MNFTLRPWTLSDIESLARYANNPNIAKFMMDLFPHPYGEENAKNFIAFATQDTPLRILAIDVNGEAVGTIGLHPQSDIQRKNTELSYWLGEPFWGKGIATRAAIQMVEYGFSTFEMTRIFGRAFGNNPASQKVLEKAGFKLEARFEHTFFKNGEYIDELVYAVRRNI